MSLIGVMGSLAALYLLLGGEFIAAAQLVVYAGAIMVLFVFVIMLLNAGKERKAKRRLWVTFAGAAAAAGLCRDHRYFDPARPAALRQASSSAPSRAERRGRSE